VNEILSEISNKKRSKRKSLKLNPALKNLLRDSIIELINDLEKINLLSKQNDKYLPKKNFILNGTVTFNKKAVGFVKINGGSEIIVPVRKTGGALPGDHVKVEIIDKLGDRLFGKITGIRKRSRKSLILILQKEKFSKIFGKIIDIPFDLEGFYYASEYPSFTLSSKNRRKRKTKQDLKPGDFILCTPKGNWWKEDRTPRIEVEPCRFLPAKNSGDEHQRDFERICSKYNLEPRFSKETDEFLGPLENKKINPHTIVDWNERKDLRDLYTVTIDGENAKDFDDAISILDEGKKFRLFVHIADVSHYVTKDSALDREAYERGTSIYLLDNVIPMLPEILSNNICSLKAKCKRLTVTCEMIFNKNDLGNIESFKFYLSIISVNKRYTYKLSDSNKNDPDLRLMKDLGLRLKKIRNQHGKLELNMSEILPTFDLKTKKLKTFEVQRIYPTNNVIEEFMLSANICASIFMKKNKLPGLYREHERMDFEKLEFINQFLSMNGIDIKVKNTKVSQINKAIRKISGHELEKVFKYMLLRTFAQAHYSPEGIGHWGLGFKNYTHFTSPIRRYPDLAVHRIIKSTLSKESLPYSKPDLKKIGESTSTSERRAMDAERDLIKIKSCRYISEMETREIFHGFVTGISGKAIWVQLNDPPVEGTISAEYTNPNKEFNVINPFTAVIKPSLQPVGLGSKVELALKEVNQEDMKIFFILNRIIKK
jgi:ribonuclease R